MTKKITQRLIAMKQIARLKRLFEASLRNCELDEADGKAIIENEGRFIGMITAMAHQLSLPEKSAVKIDPLEVWNVKCKFDKIDHSSRYPLTALLTSAGLESSRSWEGPWEKPWGASEHTHPAKFEELKGRYFLLSPLDDPNRVAFFLQRQKKYLLADPFELACLTKEYPSLLKRYVIAALANPIVDGHGGYAFIVFGFKFGYASMRPSSVNYIGRLRDLRFLVRLKND